ncbi:MAG: glycosyltransferase family 4 protein [Bacteroidota bacterium]
MRILVHDYAGHPFQVQLARALARRGHTVRHLFSSTNQTPQGQLSRLTDDPPSFSVVGVAMEKGALEKGARSLSVLLERRRREIEHGTKVARAVADFRPDVVLSANTPLDAERLIVAAARKQDARFVKWLQDLISVAASRILRQKLPGLGALVGSYYVRVERSILNASDEVVLITEDFRPILRDWGLPDERLHTVENWAPLDEMPQRPKDNPWAQTHGLADKRVILYTGTLGLKHNPALLLQLAEHFADVPDVRVVVCTEGAGGEWLAERRAERGLENLLLLPFQPFADLPDVLATADVLTAVLEPDAGVFSVPSKVLTYLCAARPLLLAIPEENLAARIVKREQAGLATTPGDALGFVAHAERLLRDPDLRAQLGANARRYAETAFDIDAISTQFEAILEG